MNRKQQKEIDEIRCEARTISSCIDAPFNEPERCVKRQWPWDRLRLFWWRWQFKQALRKALPEALRPLLDKPFDLVTADDLNRLRLALDPAWKEYAGLSLASEADIAKWREKGFPTKISKGPNESFVEPTQAVTEHYGEEPSESSTED